MTDNATAVPRLIRLREVKQLTSLSSSTIYRLVSAGKFPAPIKLSERASAWLESDVRIWIEARIADSRPQPDKQLAA